MKKITTLIYILLTAQFVYSQEYGFDSPDKNTNVYFPEEESIISHYERIYQDTLLSRNNITNRIQPYYNPHVIIVSYR